MQVVTTMQREMKVVDPVRRVPISLQSRESAAECSKENGGESKVERGKGILQEDVWRGRKLKKGR